MCECENLMFFSSSYMPDTVCIALPHKYVADNGEHSSVSKTYEILSSVAEIFMLQI